MKLLHIVLPVFLTAFSAFGQTKTPMLVDVNWLSQHLKDPGLVLLHVGDKDEYAAKHIPGARFISMLDVSRPMEHKSDKEIMVELPDTADLRAKVASFGMSDDRH